MTSGSCVPKSPQSAPTVYKPANAQCPALCHSITSSARNRSEVGIVGLIYERLRWGCARGDLVLRFGREIAGVMSFVQLFFKRPGGAVDHPPALDGRALADFFRPARQVFIFVRLQELARVVVGGAVQHP